VLGALREVLASGEPMLNFETTGAGGEGTFLLNLFPIGRRGGSVELVACIFSDVTECVRAERALAEASATAGSSWPGCCRPRRMSAAASPPSCTMTRCR
jgi:hypothetical protein